MGENAGCLGILTVQIDFLGDIAGKFYLRFTIRVEILQRSKPDFQGSHQNGIIEIRFAFEIVMEVRLRHVGFARHLVDGRSVKAIVGEHLLRGVQSPLFIAGLNSCAFPRNTMVRNQFPDGEIAFFLVIAFSSSGYARIRESVMVADVPYYTKYDPVNSAAWDDILEMSLYGRDSPLSLCLTSIGNVLL